MGIFYAYAKDVAPGREANGERYLMTFASPEAADRWYIDVSNPYRGIDRITPQFYTYDSNTYNQLPATITDHTCAPNSLNSVIFTRLPSRDSQGPTVIIPTQDIRLHLSGQSYFIRSKTQPTIYWHVARDNTIMAGPGRRSKFIVRLITPRTINVMVGNDQISISPVWKPNSFVRPDGRNGLMIAGNQGVWQLQDFRNYFITYKEMRERRPGSDVEVSRLIVYDPTRNGEEWELV